MPTIVTVAAVCSVLSFAVAMLLVLAMTRKRGTRISTHVSLERIKEMGELTVMTAYIKEIVTMRTEEQNLLSTTGKILLICAFDIEFRYDLRKAKISTKGSDGKTTIFLPPHFIKSIPKKTIFYDERKAAYLGVFNVDFSVDERNRLIDEAGTEAAKQAGILQGDLQEKVRASAKATLTTLAEALGNPNVIFAFEDGETVVKQISEQIERNAA